MPVDQSLVGREFPPTAPVRRHRGAGPRVRRRHRRRRTTAGPAPATFPIVLAFDAMNAFLDAESIDLFRIVHGEQKFAYERPVVAGDVLTATLTVGEPAPDRRQRHHRHHQRDHRRRRRAGLHRRARPSSTAAGAHERRHRACATADLHRSPAPTWSPTPTASGDHNPIHQDEEVARSVGLPGVIAHGMYTMALAAARRRRAWRARRRGRRARLQVHQAGRRARRRAASRSRWPARSRASTTA